MFLLASVLFQKLNLTFCRTASGQYGGGFGGAYGGGRWYDTLMVMEYYVTGSLELLC